jgi:hypothetical protein
MRYRLCNVSFELPTKMGRELVHDLSSSIEREGAGFANIQRVYQIWCHAK